jgi:hypothetical protein
MTKRVSFYWQLTRIQRKAILSLLFLPRVPNVAYVTQMPSALALKNLPQNLDLDHMKTATQFLQWPQTHSKCKHRVKAIP